MKIINALSIAAVTMFALIAAPSQAQAPVPLKIIAVGDSLTAGVGAGFGGSYPDSLARRCGTSCEVINDGHGGQCLVFPTCGAVVTMRDTFETEVLSQSPDVVIIGGGRNDFCHVSTEDLIISYRAMRRKAEAVGTEVHFATITPAGDAWPWPCEEQRNDVNAWMMTQSGTLDFEAVTVNKDDSLKGKYDSGDGLHMNRLGYRRVATVAYSAIVK